MDNIALITARGGSIRLPRKNIKTFNGLPLVAWSIIQAKCSKLIDEVILTTDSDEIAKIGEQFGARVIVRPVFDNDVSAGHVLKLAVEELKVQGICPNNIVYMLPTSPLRKPSDLDQLILAFRYDGYFLGEYPFLGELTEMLTFSPEKEMYIYKNESSMNEYGKSYYLDKIVSDKDWNYSKFVGGWGIGKTDYLLNFWKDQGMYDSVIDKNLDKYNNKNILGFAIEPWQCFETDYLDQFKLCEIIMEQFILKGLGIKVYTDYAKANGKNINFDLEPEQLKLGV